MRTLSAKQTIVLDTGDYGVFSKVQIKDGGGNWVDYSNLDGLNWIEEVEYDEDVDEPVASAAVTFRLDHFKLSLAPLNAASKYNLVSAMIEAGREIVIHTAVVPLGSVPSGAPVGATEAGDWMLVFHGETDEVDTPIDVDDSRVKITCRDLGARLQDRWLEEDGTPGALPGPPWAGDPIRYVTGADDDVQDVMQFILDHWSAYPAAGTISLYTPVSPSWMLKGTNAGQQFGYGPGKVSVLEALTTLADMIGWKVRYRWDSGTTAFRLTFYEPDRAKAVHDWTIPSRKIRKFSKFNRSRIGVRNIVRVTYHPDPADKTKKSKVTLSDATSITAYGRRFMEIAEGHTSAINTSTEATKLATAAMNDLRSPRVDADIEMSYDPRAQVEDLVRIEPTRVNSANQNAAVMNVRHKISGRSATTTLSVRGDAPAGQWSKWHDLMEFNQTAVNTDTQTAVPGAWTLVATAILGGVNLSLTGAPQVADDFECVEWHKDTASSAFTPSDSTKHTVTKTTTLQVTGLTQGTTYHWKAVIVKKSGIKSTPSAVQSLLPGTQIAQVQVTTGLSMESTGSGNPYAFLIDEAGTNYVRNPSFEVNTTRWSNVGTGAISRTTTAGEFFVGVAGGKIAVPAGSAAANGAKHDDIAAANNEVWLISAFLNNNKNGIIGYKIRLKVEVIHTDTVTVLSTTTLTESLCMGWRRMTVKVTCPAANTGYIRITIDNNAELPTGAYDIYVDGVQAEKNNTASSYLDGSLGPGYAWTGAEHDSSSTRTFGVKQSSSINSPDTRPTVWYRDGRIRIGGEHNPSGRTGEETGGDNDGQALIQISDKPGVSSGKVVSIRNEDTGVGASRALEIAGTWPLLISTLGSLEIFRVFGDANANVDIIPRGTGRLRIGKISGSLFLANSGTITTFTFNAWTKVIYDGEQVDQGNNYTHTTSTYQTPSEGVYFFFWTTNIVGLADQQDFRTRLNVGGAGSTETGRVNNSGTGTTGSQGALLQTLGSGVNVFVEGFNGDTVNRSNSGSINLLWGGFRIS